METVNGAWLSAVPNRLNGKELSQEEFRDNFRLKYEMMPQEIHATCNGCRKRFFIKHALSFPKGGLFLALHNDTSNEWGALGTLALVHSAITYEPKINSRRVQGGEDQGQSACCNSSGSTRKGLPLELAA